METSSSSTGAEAGLDFFFDFLAGAATGSGVSLDDADEEFDFEFTDTFFWLASSSTGAALDFFFDFLTGTATGSDVSSEEGDDDFDFDFDFTDSFLWLGTELSLSLSLSLSLDEETACHQLTQFPLRPPNSVLSVRDCLFLPLRLFATAFDVFCAAIFSCFCRAGKSSR